MKKTAEHGEQPTSEVVIRVTKNCIAVNVLLAVLKLIAGLFGKSSAMLSDAVHTISDIAASIIVIIGAKFSGKRADECHPYGHERLECVPSLILAGVMIGVGAGIGYSGLRQIFSGGQEALQAPELISLIAAVISIVVNEALFRYERAAGKRANSVSLTADAWHKRSDALASIGSLVGIVGARLGFPILDPIACVVICLFIFKAAFKIMKESLDKMVDKSCDPDTVKSISELVVGQSGVLRVDDIKTRQFGSKVCVDIEIASDGKQSLEQAHETAHTVCNIVEAKFPFVKHCMVHVNPLHNGEHYDGADC